MEQIEIIVTKDVKGAAMRETLNQYTDSVATLCYNPSTGYAEVCTGADDEIVDGVVQIVDLSETDACGSYIDSLVDPDARLHIPGNPAILALWGIDGDSDMDSLVDEYVAMSARDDDVDWGIWVKYNALYLYTLDDAAFDLWELIVEDIEYDGRYTVAEEE